MLNKKGFTLIEVMTAIAVIAIISGPLLYMFLTSTKVGRESYDTDKANTVAVQTVEAIKANPGAITLPESGDYTAYDYYDVNWQPTGSSDYYYRTETTVTGAAGSDSVGLSYIPELVDGSGQPYIISVDLGANPDNSYTLDLTQNDTGTEYTLSCGSNSLTAGGTTSQTLVIPESFFVSDVLPIVVDNEANDDMHVTFFINDSADVKPILYVYGDALEDEFDTHLVTAVATTGTIGVSYMDVSNSSISFNELEVTVKVIRAKDNQDVCDYSTKVYLTQ